MGNVFDRNGNIRSGASTSDIAKLAQTSDYLGFQNFGIDENGEARSNGGKKRLQALESARNKLRNKLFDRNGNLRNPWDKNSKDMHDFQKLNKALGNLDKVKEAAKQRKAQEEREKKKAADLDTCAKKLNDIDTKLKDAGL